MKIFITGDTHADFSRLQPGVYPALDTLTKADYLIICGDFGGIWSGDAAEQQHLDALNERPFTTLFVSGNHENYDLLAKFPVSKWHGGNVQLIRPSVIHLMRGQIFTLGKLRFFTMGGASSHDISDGILEPDDPALEKKFRKLYYRGALFRINHLSWWKEELPSPEEYREARQNLAQNDWTVDYIITHCAPTSVQNALSGGAYAADALTDFFDEIQQKCQFKNWFFGHYHANGSIANKFVVLYENIIELTEGLS